MGLEADAPDDTLTEPVDSARKAWESWWDAPSGHSADAALSLAEHLEGTAEPLLAAVQSVRTAATTRLSALEDVWQPLATRLAAWCDQWDACLAARPVLERLTEAEKWLKTNDLRLKNERLEPLQDGAKAAWTKLRQESNVDLGTLTLTGTGNQRRVRIDASVDGTEVQGFTVLSQGELHALALSLFIPRATMADSPFRFLVLDDPIQAMDPAKVDGLVELLTDLAQTRQVIVLSHDDRLPAAVRRSAVDATILEVTRGRESTGRGQHGHRPGTALSRGCLRFGPGGRTRPTYRVRHAADSAGAAPFRRRGRSQGSLLRRSPHVGSNAGRRRGGMGGRPDDPAEDHTRGLPRVAGEPRTRPVGIGSLPEVRPADDRLLDAQRAQAELGRPGRGQGRRAPDQGSAECLMSELLELAVSQLAAADAHANRRACWLARSAMEERLDALLLARDIETGPHASTRSKLSCLEAAYADEPELANRAQYLWSRLSEACHQHAYELSPTYTEVRHLLDLLHNLEAVTNRGADPDG